MDPPRRRRQRLCLQHLPVELIEEVLVRCTVDTIQNLTSIWPRCTSIVRNPKFQERFLSFNLKAHEETLLFASETMTGWDFTTLNLPKSTSSFLSSSSNPRRQMEYAMGLICSGFGDKVTIFNPTSGVSRKLPIFPRTTGDVKTYLGFDSSTNCYKVFGMAKGGGDEEWKHHHVITIDGRKPSFWNWRPVTCDFPHSIFPYSMSSEPKSVCINGTVFYPAHLLKKKKIAMMQFHLATETYQLNEIPHPSSFGLFYWDSALLEIRGRVGVSFSVGGGDHRIWILEDQKEDKWSSLLVRTSEIHHLIDRPCPSLALEGFTRHGDVVFSQTQQRVLVLYVYNRNTKTIEKTCTAKAGASIRMTFWNHQASLMFI